VSGRRARNLARAAALGGCALVLAGCGSSQSTLEPESPASHKITHLWWVMFIGSTIVFAVVVVLLLAAILGSRGRLERPIREDTRLGRVLVFGGGAVLPLVVLVGLFVLILQTLPATSQARGKPALAIDVVGHQWFWGVRYVGRRLVTANEIHIPVGKAVDVRVSTADVIHSLWIPGLNRKLDLIPGKPNHIPLQADRPGTYRGQCAEFCGLQHANMALYVVAEQPAEFRAWLARESRPAAPPATAEAKRGQRIFLGEGCSGCHAVAGTPANGHVGPDLTHFGGRLTIGAGTIPNEKGDLGGWILDPQHFKPGNKMPGFQLGGPELTALIDYLEGLK
jgi:cytochrome c oxidase subunit II